MRIMRGIRHNEFVEIRNRTFSGETVKVYYGFNTYRSDPEYIDKIKEKIKSEYPRIAETDMREYFITTEDSDTHANITTVEIEVSVSKVRKRLSDYTIL